MPALVIIVDEYAELADEAPDAMSDTDSIARLGRAVAVTLVAATQRPTQKAMGQGAVRSQMDTRICFRVRERKDVDLVLGQGMLSAGWHAHALNAPGKFLVSAPEHTTPERARAYLVTDDDVARTVERYARSRPALDDVSRAALRRRRASRTGAVVPPKPPPRRRASPATPRTIPTPPHPKARSGPLSARHPRTEPTSPSSCGPAAWDVPRCTATLPSSPRPAGPSRSGGAVGARPSPGRLTMSDCLIAIVSVSCLARVCT